MTPLPFSPRGAEVESRSLPPPPPGRPATPDEAALQRWWQEAWPTDARYLRVFSLLCMAAHPIAWVIDWSFLGTTPRAFLVLAVHVTGSLAMAPMLRATYAPRPPRTLGRDKLIAVACGTGAALAAVALTPSTAAVQGWIMFCAWSLSGLTVNAPLRAKVAIHAAGVAVFAAIVTWQFTSRGPAYGVLPEVVAMLLGAAFVALTFPLVPHRMQRHRLRERMARLRLEEEIELREQRERELVEHGRELVTRERDLLEAKRRADRAAEDARISASKVARDAKARTELFANMSHDLRTPMAGILGLVDLLAGTPLTPEQASYIETIRASNQTLLSLLDDVIDFSRIEEGKLPIVAVSSPLADTLRRPADLVRVTAERKELKLLVELPPDLPEHVTIDPARIQQILLNLLGNAVKFTQQGKVTLRARMVHPTGGGDRLRVEVEDTGIGFTAEQKNRLFRRFSQAEEGIVHKFGGSGLGLSICRGLVELMGGEIGAEGQPGRGALFWFEVPAEESHPPSVRYTGTVVPSLRVLLAEDNPVNQLVVSMMLKKLGQEVIVASDGEQALRLLMQERFHLAILDMQMPVMDGMEVTRRIRGASARAGLTYVVALTASATTEEKERFLRAGVDAVYTKPIDMDRLRHMLIKEGAAAEARIGKFTPKKRAAVQV